MKLSSDRAPTQITWRNKARRLAAVGIDAELEKPSAAIQILGQRLNLFFAPHWRPVVLDPKPQIKWTPKRSEHVTKAEQQLAVIVHWLMAGLNCAEIAKRTGIHIRTVQRKVAYLLSFEEGSENRVATEETEHT